MKQFLIVGNINAVKYKEVFPFIKEDKLWLGLTFVKEFKQPNGEIKKFGNICWFTNLENEKHNRFIELYKHYSNEYKHYDNYDAIEVSRTKDIPCDYPGVMAVPITFLDKYNPNQFEIVDLINNPKQYFNGKSVYARLLIKRR